MRPSSSRSAVAAAVLLLTLQGPGTRLTYRMRVLERVTPGGADWELASGSVSGSLDTDLRFSLRSDSTEIEALFHVAPDGDTVNIAADFFTKRRVGRSRRGLPVWEQDAYRRGARVAWGDTLRVYLSGRRRAAPSSWIELAVERGFTGGEGRPGEELRLAEGAPDVRFEAVVRPRRARVVMNLVRGDTVSAPRAMDLVPDAPLAVPRRTQLVIAGRTTALEVSLVRPEPAASDRDRVLALDADVVCLRVVPQGAAQPVGVLCGRLNNVARRLPLPQGDTLLVTFAWPAGR